MHQTTAPKREDMTIRLAPLADRANFLPIGVQIQLHAIADKRKTRRTTKERNRTRNKYKPE